MRGGRSQKMAEAAFDSLFTAAKRAELPVAAVLFMPDGKGKKGRIAGASVDNLFDSAATMLETFLQYINPEERAAFVAQVGDAALQWSIARDGAQDDAGAQGLERLRKAREADAETMRAFEAEHGPVDGSAPPEGEKPPGVYEDADGFKVTEKGDILLEIPSGVGLGLFIEAHRMDEGNTGTMARAIETARDHLRETGSSALDRLNFQGWGFDQDTVVALLNAGYLRPVHSIGFEDEGDGPDDTVGTTPEVPA